MSDIARKQSGETGKSTVFDNGSGFFYTQWQRIKEHDPLYEHAEAAYWELLWHRDYAEKYWTRAEKLSVGWGQAFALEVKGLAHLLGLLKERGELPPLPAVDCADLSQAMELIRTGAIGPLLEYVADAFVRRTSALRRMVRPPEAFEEYSQKVSNGLLSEILDVATSLYFLDPHLTQFGRKAAWLTSSWDVMTFDINPEHFPLNSPIKEYWLRRPFGLGVNIGRVIGAGDYPLDDRVGADGQRDKWASLPMASDPESSFHAAVAMMDEATENKKWTIPHKAVVQLPVGPFAYFEVSEIEQEVFFVGRTDEGHNAMMTLDPYRHTFDFPNATWGIGDSGEPSQEPETKKSVGIRSALLLLMASIVRDFWVVEEREAVFREIVTKRGLRHGDHDDSPRVVYLPRVHYNRPPDLERCQNELAHQERRAHSVRGHLRRAEHRSVAQLLMAERYGFEVPTGHTFVRPHERGGHAREVIYRSRSALRSLYTTTPTTEGLKHPSRWFQFERDVYDLMVALGFTVQHVSAPRRGDKGVDVYASKGDDFDQVNWVIQCKCYGPKRPVSPHVVRELSGVLRTYPRGTRGMIVTTSRFTDGAVQAAETEDIRLVDGEEFIRLLEATRQTG